MESLLPLMEKTRHRPKARKPPKNAEKTTMAIKMKTMKMKLMGRKKKAMMVKLLTTLRRMTMTMMMTKKATKE